jgi:Ran GTPase-activating protein (RanGAP) involved in mRNA processing and transport
MGLPPVMRASALRPTLTQLRLCGVRLGLDEARLLRVAVCTIPSLQSLVLTDNTLGSAELAELAPALYHNTSIKVLDIRWNDLSGIESARLLRDTFAATRLRPTLICLGMNLGKRPAPLIALCHLGDGGVSILTQSLRSRNTTLEKLTLDWKCITSTGVGALLEMM